MTMFEKLNFMKPLVIGGAAAAAIAVMPVAAAEASVGSPASAGPTHSVFKQDPGGSGWSQRQLRLRRAEQRPRRWSGRARLHHGYQCLRVRRPERGSGRRARRYRMHSRQLRLPATAEPPERQLIHAAW